MEKLSERPSLNRLIAEVKTRLSEDHIEAGNIFEKCIRDTLNTTVQVKEDGTTFVITGDIPAMWLRDSACQVRPYLMLAREDPAIADMLEGVIRRQISCILTDPYANAFNETANGNRWSHDRTEMKPEVWERKYEIDSLCFPVQLAYLFWKNSGRISHFDSEFMEAARKIIGVFRTEQDHEHKSQYSFERDNCIFMDTLSREGRGALVNEKAGLIWSGFRPSDDACTYGYLIPSNMFAAVILEYLSEISACIYHDQSFADETAAFAEQLRTSIAENAVVPGGERFKPFYAYEVDGFGQYLIMDDANVPSLLSIPYLGFCSEDDVLYKNTREIILSDSNPYYYSGKYLTGIGSMHTPARYVWHIALGMQGLTSSSRAEKKQIIQTMVAADGGTDCMHEGICADDPSEFTRPWFSWANAVFAELVLDYCGYRIVK